MKRFCAEFLGTFVPVFACVYACLTLACFCSAQNSNSTNLPPETSFNDGQSRELIAAAVFQKLSSVRFGLQSQAQNSGPPFTIVPRAEPLQSDLEKIDSSFEFRLAFYVNDQFLVDPRKVGKSYGAETNRIFQTGKEENYSKGLVWVLPWKNGNKQYALILMSSIAPKQTSLLLVNDNMQIQLIYDSYMKPRGALKTDSSGIDYLCGVRVLAANRFLLYEGWLPGISQVSMSPRSFILTIGKGNTIEIENAFVPGTKAARRSGKTGRPFLSTSCGLIHSKV